MKKAGGLLQADKMNRWDLEEAIQRGMAAAQAGDRAMAHGIFREVTERQPDNAEAWVWLAGTSPNLDDAESAFSHAKSLNPANEEANLGLRWVALRRQMVRPITGPMRPHTSGPLSERLMRTGPLSGSVDSLAPADQAATTDAAASAEAAADEPAEVAPAPSRGLMNLPTPVVALLILAVVAVLLLVIMYALGVL